MSAPIPQDTINFMLRADTVVVSETVKIVVTINTMSSAEKPEDVLRAEIKSALAKLIPTAEWHFSNIDRSEDSTGYERISLQASTRVSEKENYKLDERAKKASIQGLSLSEVVVDPTVPVYMLEAAEKSLRLEIIKKAQDELAEIVELTKRPYRINAIAYHNQSDPVNRKMAAMSTSNYANTMSGGGGVADDDGSLTNAQKVTLTASLTLAVFAIDKGLEPFSSF